MSCDNDATRGFGPLLPGHLKVDFGDADALKKIFKGLIILFMLSPSGFSQTTVIFFNCQTHTFF